MEVPFRSDELEVVRVVEGKEDAEVCLFNCPKTLPFVGGRIGNAEVILILELKCKTSW